MNWYDSAVTRLENSLVTSEISHAEFAAELHDLNAELRGAAEDAAEQAYNDTVGNRQSAQRRDSTRWTLSELQRAR